MACRPNPPTLSSAIRLGKKKELDKAQAVNLKDDCLAYVPLHNCASFSTGEKKKIHFQLLHVDFLLQIRNERLFRDVGVTKNKHRWRKKVAKVWTLDDVGAAAIVGNWLKLPVSWPDVWGFSTTRSVQKFWSWSKIFVSDNFSAGHRCTTIPQLFYHPLTNQNYFNWHVIGGVQLRGAWRGGGLGGNKMASGKELEIDEGLWITFFWCGAIWVCN